MAHVILVRRNNLKIVKEVPRGRVTAPLTPSIVPADLLRAFEPILPDRKYAAGNIEFVCGDSCVEIDIEPVIRGETIEGVPEPHIGAVQHLPALPDSG